VAADIELIAETETYAHGGVKSTGFRLAGDPAFLG
jgi:hypothetical protein